MGVYIHPLWVSSIDRQKGATYLLGMIEERSCASCLFFGECRRMNTAIVHWKVGKVNNGREHLLSDDFDTEKKLIYENAAEQCPNYVEEPRRY